MRGHGDDSPGRYFVLHLEGRGDGNARRIRSPSVNINIQKSTQRKVPGVSREFSTRGPQGGIVPASCGMTDQHILTDKMHSLPGDCW